MQHGYKIGEVAELLGVTVRTIRYYEEAGLVEPLRTDGGTRLYGERHVARLRAILHLAGNGFSLEVIRLIAAAREGSRSGDEGSGRVTARLDGLLAELTSRIEQTEQLRDEVVRARSWVRKCRGCSNRPTSKGCPDCPVRKHITDVELLGLIWDQEG
ncbi:MAG TPA: MerR family transcriptional regulator [Gammaproteobacteria bacterium]